MAHRAARQAICAIFAILLFAAASPAGEAVSVDSRWRGVFEPRREAIIASETSMLIKQMPLEPGDSCREGDTLVVFDDTLPKVAVASAAAKIKAMELNAEGLRNLYQRSQATAIEAAKAESDLAQARLELAAAEREVRVCRVVAPFAGKIVERRAREFEWVNRGGPLLILVDDAVLRARFFLPEDKFADIKIGDPVRVRAPAVDRDVRGTISSLGVVFDPVSRTFDVWADVPNADDALRTGMTAEVEWPVAGGDPQ